ncbi:hypothetical protein SAMN05421825_0774 [Epilithonimonas hungarica]|uniref:Uncharacterized protein n=1 Tax=Epilithonimonas hungarica TaxID=454006 RepID=A0A1G7HEL4_9FLAO|nr:hypothetical protein SAMN05421825_0774 [Epilithonimonas hungarica]
MRFFYAINFLKYKYKKPKYYTSVLYYNKLLNYFPNNPPPIPGIFGILLIICIICLP